MVGEAEKPDDAIKRFDKALQDGDDSFIRDALRDEMFRKELAAEIFASVLYLTYMENGTPKFRKGKEALFTAICEYEDLRDAIKKDAEASREAARETCQEEPIEQKPYVFLLNQIAEFERTPPSPEQPDYTSAFAVLNAKDLPDAMKQFRDALLYGNKEAVSLALQNAAFKQALLNQDDEGVAKISFMFAFLVAPHETRGFCWHEESSNALAEAFQHKELREAIRSNAAREIEQDAASKYSKGPKYRAAFQFILNEIERFERPKGGQGEPIEVGKARTTESKIKNTGNNV